MAAITLNHEAAVVLGRAQLRLDPVLRAAVDTLPSSLRRIIGYHFGWWDADGGLAAGAPGKAIRPALVLAASEAFGGGPETAVQVAAAVELVHNFTLIHDDVMDADPTRRNRPTVWSVYGAANAILAGDALHALAGTVVMDAPETVSSAAMARLSAAVAELCEGQYADCAFEQRANVSLDECLEMAEAKTGALFGCACALGAQCAGADGGVVDAMDAFGRQVGIAFQLADDLIGIWGDPAIPGKPVGSDLIARKKSLPVVAALTSGTAEAKRLKWLYGCEQANDPAALAHMTRLIEATGARAWAEQEADRRLRSALEYLGHAAPQAAACPDLRAIASVLTQRGR